MVRLHLTKIRPACAFLGLLVGGILLLQVPAQSAPQTQSTMPPDTDGEVPVEGKCEPEGNPEWGEEWLGMYQWKTVRDDSGNAKEIYGKVYLNLCRMDALGLTKDDKLAVLRHEKAHSRGWNHGEGTPDTNPAYHVHYDFDR